jgi:hypothetical protein
MIQRKIANALGYASIFCSLAFWIWIALFLFTPLNRSDAWLELGAGSDAFVLWTTMWIAGLLLALIAAVVGSRRWAFVSVLPLLSFALAALVASTIEW